MGSKLIHVSNGAPEITKSVAYHKAILLQSIQRLGSTNGHTMIPYLQVSCSYAVTVYG